MNRKELDYILASFTTFASRIGKLTRAAASANKISVDGPLRQLFLAAADVIVNSLHSFRKYALFCNITYLKVSNG